MHIKIFHKDKRYDNRLLEYQQNMTVQNVITKQHQNVVYLHINNFHKDVPVSEAYAKITNVFNVIKMQLRKTACLLIK